MPDMLVKLYDLEDDWSFIREYKKKDITIRKPIGAEKHNLIQWVKDHFGDAWASETDVCTGNVPISCFVAVQNGSFAGFSCYDGTALGFFGPIGVAQEHRGKGLGKALLMSCLLDMKLKGYGYAIIGMTDKDKFYNHCAGAVVIPGSEGSVWKTWVKE